MIAKKCFVFFPAGAAVILGFSADRSLANEALVASYGPALETCYVDASSTAEREACIGVMSSTCSAREEGGETTLGITSCLLAETTDWDGFLNAEYQAAQAGAKSADADEAVYFPEFANWSQALLDAQRAWIAFRDAECSLAYAAWGGRIDA